MPDPPSTPKTSCFCFPFPPERAAIQEVGRLRFERQGGCDSRGDAAVAAATPEEEGRRLRGAASRSVTHSSSPSLHVSRSKPPEGRREGRREWRRWRMIVGGGGRRRRRVASRSVEHPSTVLPLSPISLDPIPLSSPISAASGGANLGGAGECQGRSALEERGLAYTLAVHTGEHLALAHFFSLGCHGCSRVSFFARCFFNFSQKFMVTC
jgi:hypothetical protein